MGMFDYIRCEIPLEHEGLEGVDTTKLDFQTKSADRAMGTLQITEEGRLVDHQQCRTGDWPQSIWYDPVDLNFHGDILFYTGIGERNEVDNRWIEFKATFEEGQLQEIQAIRVDKICRYEATTIWEKNCDRNAGEPQ